METAGTDRVFIGSTGALCQFVQCRLKSSNQIIATTNKHFVLVSK